MKKEQIIGTCALICVIVIFGLFYRDNEKSKFKSKGKITIAKVTAVEDDYKLRPFVSFDFSINERIYSGTTPYPEFKSKIESYLLHRTFPVIYIDSNPLECEILISRASFARFDLIFPDSLSWTTKLEVSPF